MLLPTLTLLLAPALAPTPNPASPPAAPPQASDLRARIETYAADRAALRRRYAAPLSERRRERLAEFERRALAELEALDPAGLDVDGRIDRILLANEIRGELAALELEAERAAEIESLVPFARTIVALVEAREDVEPVDPDPTARALARLAEDVGGATARLEAGEFDATTPVVAGRAARDLGRLGRALDEWYRFRAGYDPLFTWWLEAPTEAALDALEAHRDALERRLVASEAGRDATLVADPLGPEALTAALTREFVPYTPKELIDLALAELEACDALLVEASRELGFEDDWRAAQEHVRGLHVPPGEQPALVAGMVREAIDFVAERDLLTVPDLARETWRMTMLSPERQRTSPYFLGGEEIQVAFPTASMPDADKRATLAGNNVHFSRAVVHHEVIPGHHLQQFVQARHRPYRRLFSTPFWVEGWALYWELRLWELGFPRGPEDRVGMLFWRKHRAARIVFSLSIQLGTMTGEEAVDFLVERVGHRRRNAEAEVRRSVGGVYPPLYQAAYLVGGWQLRALHRELVEEGGWSERAFHDAVLHQNAIPIELVRAALTGERLPLDFETRWRFRD
jgi:uncharacterized protein (DUF885 family)